MKNIKMPILLLCSAAILVFSSCKKSFLDVEPRGLVLEINYYKTPAEAFSGLVACYDPLVYKFDPAFANALAPLNAAADECWAGGGGPTDLNYIQVWNTYTLTAAEGPQNVFWIRNFTGINRVNTLLGKIQNVPGLDASLKTRYIAEAKFLRGYYYFWLVRLFKNVPLFTGVLSPDEIKNITQATPEAVYAQIETDLKDAIPNLPATIPSSENGRITKGAGNALLGKVILYQNNNSRMQEAANYFELVNSAPGYSLYPNYAQIFNPANEFSSESVFEINHTSAQAASWNNWPNFEGNIYSQLVGPRSYAGPLYASGWSFNTIIPAFATFMKTDPRYVYTVADIDSVVAAAPGRSYTAGHQNTGFFIQKFAPLQAHISTSGAAELNWPINEIEIRLADTYLMQAEALVRGGGDLNKAQTRLNQVRARVGLLPVPVTLDNIYNERRLELATEGHRWFDLVRTGKAAQVLSFKNFVAGKHEILPIPLAELNNTKLKQNPGY